MPAASFKRRFLFYILLTWVLPPLFGISLLLFMGMFTPGEIAAVVRGSGFGYFALATTLFALWYFNRFSRPWLAYIDNPDAAHGERALGQLRRFALHYWGLFVLTMAVRPSFIMLSVGPILGWEASAQEWLRIHLVLLIVFILIGLPLFLRITDLLGLLLGRLELERPRLTIRVKIFLIGSLVPLLISTIMVLYFWSRTGYFASETIAIWILLEMVAVGGTLLFVRSISQSLSPLQSLIRKRRGALEFDLDLETLCGASTDELGILTNEYRRLLQHHTELTARLRESEVWSKNVLANMQDTFYRTDIEGHIVYITPMVEQALGYTPDELTGTRMAELYLNPSDRERFLLELQHNGGTVRNYTAPLRHRDGSTVWASTNAHYYRDEKGNIAGVEGNSRDITKLKLVEQALQHERQRLLATLESITDAVITTDLAGNIDYLNPVAERLLGESERAIGSHYSGVVPLYEEQSGNRMDDLVETALEHQASFVNASNGILRRPGEREYVLKVSCAVMYRGDEEAIGAVLVLHDITETVEMTRQLNYQASHDALTGLVNRREFERRLRQAIHSTSREEEEHVLLYMDLDQFKVVNDTCGHRAGDELLKQLALQLGQPLRSSDTLARLGGDEFAVLLRRCSLEAAQRLADRIRQMVKEFRFVWEDKSFGIGVSIGVVPFNSATSGMDQLLSAADAACYFAKDLGRDRVYTYDEGDEAILEHHGEMNWVHRITEAFEEGRFNLYAQHIAPLHDSDELPHYELLLRMVNSEGQLVPPMAFVPAAERYHLMPTIDRWVIRTAFSMLCEAERQGGSVPIGVSINLSGQSLADDNFLDFIIDQFELSGLVPMLVCFEITETAAITNLSRAMKLFGELRKRGCSFSLDDFGSGLSSFGYLKTLPVDYLKIDGVFVKDMLEDPIDETMVEAIHKVSRVMELRTIAEYVESEAIAERLRQLGVDFAQGNAIAEPEPLADVLGRYAG